MIKKSALVATLLLSDLANVAAAAEPPEHLSKNARKVIATLNMLGINSQDVQQFVAQADSRANRKHFYFDRENTKLGELSLRYQLYNRDSANPLSAGRGLELHYAPQDSHWQMNARTNSVTLSYHLEFR